jgi:hypothetical protein
VILDSAIPNDVYGLANNVLNVLQTLALAYLAADRHNVNAQRKQGAGTRATDRVG